jgi:hypothetical protein
MEIAIAQVGMNKTFSCTKFKNQAKSHVKTNWM